MRMGIPHTYQGIPVLQLPSILSGFFVGKNVYLGSETATKWLVTKWAMIKHVVSERKMICYTLTESRQRAA